MSIRDCTTCLFYANREARALQALSCKRREDGRYNCIDLGTRPGWVDAKADLKTLIQKPFIFSKAAPTKLVKLIELQRGLTAFTRAAIDRALSTRLPLSVNTVEEIDKYFIDNPPLYLLAAIRFDVRPGCFNSLVWPGFGTYAESRAVVSPHPTAPDAVPDTTAPVAPTTATRAPTTVYLEGSCRILATHLVEEIWYYNTDEYLDDELFRELAQINIDDFGYDINAMDANDLGNLLRERRIQMIRDGDGIDCGYLNYDDYNNLDEIEYPDGRGAVYDFDSHGLGREARSVLEQALEDFRRIARQVENENE